LMASLQGVDPFRANLGAVTSDLMLMGFRLKERIDAALCDATSPLGTYDNLMPAIDGYLRIVRQLDRLAQLDRFRASANAGTSSVKP
jgi:hypothetical protein